MTTVQDEFTIRKKVFSVLGAKFHIYDHEGKLIGFSKQKAFKLKEDIKVYSDESMTKLLVSINARSVIDFSAAYDVTDTTKSEVIGALRRKGLSSIVRDEWMVLSPGGSQIGSIHEDSAALALVRRFLPLGNLVPQRHHMADSSGTVLAEYRTHFNPFVHKMTVTVFENSTVSPHLVLAAGILMVAIEGRQSN